MDSIMSTLEVDADTDYLFEGFVMVTNGSTNIYLEANLTPLTWVGRNIPSTWVGRSATNGQTIEAFHQRNHSIPTLYILLEN